MAAPPRRDVVRRLAAAAPAPVRRAVLLARGRMRSTVSAHVLVTDDDVAFLGECLSSLARQRRPVDEVVLAVAGTRDDTWAEVRAHVRGRWRRRAVPVAVGAAAPARDVAGTYALLLTAGDLLTDGAVEALAGALDGSGSDLAMTGDRVVSGATLADTPSAFGWCDRAPLLLRAAGPRDRGEALSPRPAGRPEPPWVASMRRLLAARAFDAVDDPVRRGRRRGTGVSFSALPRLAPLVPEVANAVEEAVAALDTRLPAATSHLARWLLAGPLPAYLDDAERCTPEQWERLAELAAALLGRAGGKGVREVPVEARVRAWLAAEGRRAQLERFAAARWLEDGQHPTRVAGGRVYAELPHTEGVPVAVLERAPEETSLRTRLRRARWTPDGLLELQVAAFVPGVGAEHGPAAVDLALVGEDGTRIPLAAWAEIDVDLRAEAGERFADHADRVAGTSLDAGLLAARPPQRWRLQVGWEAAGVRREAAVAAVDPRGSAGAVPPRLVAGRAVRVDPRSAALVCAAADDGAAPAAPVSAAPAVDALLLDGDDLVLEGHAPHPATVELHGAAATVSAPVEVSSTGGRFSVRLPLRHDRWGLGETPLPAGGYRLRGAVPAPDLVARTPLVLRSAAYRLRALRAGEGLELALGPALADDEVGPVAQQALRRWYAEDGHRVDPRTVYLQSFTGQTATDSPLAIHHELRRRRPELRLVWAVADASTRVPAGGEAVVIRSREWHRALATSGHVVTNVDLEGWFRKRPGQRVLQTFHGHPSKAMGISAWEAKNLTPLRIERQLRRTSGTWDLLLTPSPEMDVHYREQYRYDGPIHSFGYPRDDVLAGADADRLRAEARERLGIGERTAVLYAPTWRDDLATDFRSAALPATFDVQRAAERLGDRYVLLLRGHRFHRRRGVTGGTLLDVTEYPEINDLVLACDAAVLDYSSLRFDVALTGRPMVFLVPDLDRYEGAVRGFLFDFRSSTPGPLLRTTDEVVEALADLAGLRAAHDAAYTAFNRRFSAHQDGRAAARVVEAFFGGGD